jgi:hypothetical protein
VSEYFGGLRAYVESCLGQMQVGINRSKVSFQGIADMFRLRRIRRTIVSEIG